VKIHTAFIVKGKYVGTHCLTTGKEKKTSNVRIT